MLFEVRKFAEHPFARHDDQHQNEIERRGPEFDFERRADEEASRLIDLPRLKALCGKFKPLFEKQ